MSSMARLVLIDDHPIVLVGLRNLVSMERDFEVVGEATSGLAGLNLIRDTRPNIAVVDISIPEINGIALAQRIKEDNIPVRILMLTVHEDRSYLTQSLQAGVCGYVLKRSVADNLIPAIRVVLAGAVYVDPSIVGQMLGSGAGQGDARRGAKDLSTLTEREAQVLKLIVRGFSNKEIARQLDVSVKSVETYKSRGIEKLGLRSRVDIVRYGVACGWFAVA